MSKVQQDRLDKLDKIRQLGVDPYGRKFEGAVSTAAARRKFAEIQPPLPAGEKTPDPVRVAGRIVLYRDIGKLIFMTIRDSAGIIQIGLSKREVSEADWNLARLLDLGDLVGVDGPLGLTKTGELTVWARSLTMLAKSLLPPPEKWHGLTDVELRYRQRYVDLFANPDVADTFRKRSKIIEHFRRFLADRGFLEVETPMMQAICGGAAARPFATHHNALDMDLFMRISPELYLKRLLVGGLERVFEINRNFRNEGIDTRHNPEFTMMELYQAYGDYNDMMELTEQMISSAAKEVTSVDEFEKKILEWVEKETPAGRSYTESLGQKLELLKILRGDAQQMSDGIKSHLRRVWDKIQSQITQAGTEIGQIQDRIYKLTDVLEAIHRGRAALPFGSQVLDFTPPWRRATYAELLREHADVDMFDIAAVRARARERGIDDAGMADEVVINALFELAVEPHLIGPIFVVDYPAALCPLTKRHPDDPRLALRFEAYIARMEIANAYTELNDPAVQEENFRIQLKGQEETMAVMDEDFVNALQVGMPPAGGLGIGIDRVVMLLTNSASIRDVILFPLMRPTESGTRNVE